MFKKVGLLLRTIKHLKFTQVRYQLLYRLKKPGKLGDYDGKFIKENLSWLSFVEKPPVFHSAYPDNSFSFLNLKVDFGEQIDWNYQAHGKLWNYNLQYCNYLLQEDIPYEIKKNWLKSLHSWLILGKIPLEPYPVSLRTINTIRFVGDHDKWDEDLISNLHAELDFLSQRPEYHLLGNHLLENAFALMMGGAFFDNKKWLTQAEKILTAELKEQILNDGAHFELSPMYHQIILFRLLELIDWYSKWNSRNVKFEKFLRGKAEIMLSWLKEMTFSNGDIPHFNDSAPGIAYFTNWLMDYAKKLYLTITREIRLGDSGYRKFVFGKYECIVDVAEIGPSYQPGHGHADALSFILYVSGKPMLIEQGTSTYQPEGRRILERSSSAHNTVVVDGKNQSAVWGAFRVADRAEVTILENTYNRLIAYHDGYRKMNIIHQRSFEFLENRIRIVDLVKGGESKESIAYFHLHPDCVLKQCVNRMFINETTELTFTGAVELTHEEYQFAEGYNKYRQAKRIKVKMQSELITEICFN